ncbi:MAG TPA: SAF domain-containing protein [Jatrophihabitans sp.]|nr:SAF domain-containing protein [Jatrophihabitans sp.]
MFDALRRRLPRIGRWPRLALAASCALLALDSAVSAHGSPTKRARTEPGRPVVIAARDLPAGRRLTSGDIAVVRWPDRLVPDSAVQDIRSLLGRRLAGSLARHEAVTTARLLGRDLTTGLGPGLVAVPVPLADSHARDLLHPGDHVDLLAAPRADDTAVAGRPGSIGSVSVAGSHLLVLAVFAASAESGTELVVAADRVTAARITRVGVAQTLAAVGVPP